MRRLVEVLSLIVVFALGGSTASAEGGFSAGLRVGQFEGTGSPDTFDAVYGGDRMTQIGLDLRYRTAGSFMLQLAADHGTLDGEYVVIGPGGAQPTGTTSELTMTPIHCTFAWTFGGPGLGFYLGAGPTYLDWEDTSSFETVSGSEVGYHAVLGVEHHFRRSFVGGEVRYSSIGDAIGQGGASAFFGEDDLGGLGLHLVLGYGF